jgi:hypothetical protein
MFEPREKKKARQKAPSSGGPLAAACLFVFGVGAGPLAAQDAGDPPLLFIDVSAGLSYEDGLDDDSRTEATTTLGVGYFSSTHDQRLSFETGVTARAREDGHDLVDPYAAIAYALFSRDTEIGVDLAYSRTDIEGDILEEDFDADDLRRQIGAREDISYGLSLVTGRTAPFGTATQLRYAESNFLDGATDDDSATYTAQSTLRFTIDPRIELRLTGFWEREETDDVLNTVETTQRLGLGTTLAFDKLWTATASLGTTEIETETVLGKTFVNGVDGAFILIRDMRNGDLAFSSEHEVTTDGWRNSVRMRRTIEMANGDTFDASIGQIFFEEGDSGTLASLAYERTVRSGSLALGVDFSSDLDEADELIERTSFNAVLRQDINDYSGWVADASLNSVQYENTATADAVRLDLGLAYLYALSNDWNLSASVEHEVLYEDGIVDDRNNVLSLDLERRFSVRP